MKELACNFIKKKLQRIYIYICIYIYIYIYIYIFIFAINFNSLEEKSARCNSYRDFSRCVKENLVPKGLELTVQPTKGNYDQGFIDKWYTKIKQLSINLMKDIATFCDSTVQKTENSINEIE